MMAGCPLCGSTQARELERYRFDDIWAGLESDWAVCLSAHVRAAHAPEEFTTARSCEDCGLEWFAPAVPGDARFYRELMRSTNYVADRWEFEVLASRVARTDRIVDLGCGDGSLVRRIAPHVARAVGVDTNADAIERLRSAGCEGSAEGFASFAAREAGAFDVVCAFQIAEHLANVEVLMAPARAMLRPRGRLFLSVPNRERAGRQPLESLDLPPHHLSRWAPPQLESLARIRGLDLVRVLHSPPLYGDLARALEVRFMRRRSPGFARVARRVLLGSHRHALLAHTGSYTRAGITGHTLLAEYRVVA